MAIPVRPGEVPSDLICAICLELPLDPYILKKCSHVFCKDCFTDSFSRQKSCPICRCSCRKQDLLPMRTAGALSYRILSSITVKCEHHAEGCGWTGSLSDYRSHKNSCPQKEKIQAMLTMEEEHKRLKAENEGMRPMKEENELLKAENERLKAENKGMKRKKIAQLKSDCRRLKQQEEEKKQEQQDLEEELDLEVIVLDSSVSESSDAENVLISRVDDSSDEEFPSRANRTRRRPRPRTRTTLRPRTRTTMRPRTRTTLRPHL